MNCMRLREVRENRKLSQSKIASCLHVQQNTYSQYENGVRQIPISLLVELAKFYNVSVDYLLRLTDFDEPYT
ncbi:MAG: helix-turn-helix transcriptional regulator [Clostridia bacterium]|nr:helix-turn-helix transcriptional regulator [Clostridia bacterium]